MRISEGRHRWFRCAAGGLVLTVAVSIAMSVIGVAPPPAGADDWGTCTFNDDVGCEPEDLTQQWCLSASTNGQPALRGAIRWAMDLLRDQTVMDEVEVACSPSVTDVRWRAMDLGHGTLGVYECTDRVNFTCYAADVTISNPTIQYAADDPAHEVPRSDGIVEPGEIGFVRDKVACHELGHSVGLMHHGHGWYADYSNDCMISGWLEAHEANDGWCKYNGHHRDDIAFYM